LKFLYKKFIKTYLGLWVFLFGTQTFAFLHKRNTKPNFEEIKRKNPPKIPKRIVGMEF